MPALRGSKIGRCVVRRQGVRLQRAKPAGRPGGSHDFVGVWLVLVVADIHPDVAPAERRHGRLPHIALVVRVVARLIEIRKGEVEDRGMEAMMPPDMALATAV